MDNTIHKYVERLIKERNDALAEVKKLREKFTWKDVNIELPEGFTNVLVYRKNIGFDNACYDPGFNEWYKDEGGAIFPTHWMYINFDIN